MKKIVAVLALLVTVSPALAQPYVDAKSGAMFDTIAAQDKRLFDAYNSCDQTGLARGRAAFIEAIKTNICGKTHRELVPGSLEAYPLKTFGAVEIGDHVFCPAATPSACNAKTSGIAKFTMLWQQTGNSWKVTRVISYDHVSGSARK